MSHNDVEPSENDLVPFGLTLRGFHTLEVVSRDYITIEALNERIPHAPWEQLIEDGLVARHYGSLPRLKLTRAGEIILHAIQVVLIPKNDL